MLSVIGCGNLNRRDDGAGIEVVRRLSDYYEASPPEGVKLFDSGTAGMEVMFKARGSQVLWVVDACRTGTEPGALFEVPGEALVAEPGASYSLHDFRWDHALFVGRRIFGDDFPKRITVFLIEAEDLGFGIGLSPRVEATVMRLIDLLIERIAGFSTAG